MCRGRCLVCRALPNLRLIPTRHHLYRPPSTSSSSPFHMVSPKSVCFLPVLLSVISLLMDLPLSCLIYLILIVARIGRQRTSHLLDMVRIPVILSLSPAYTQAGFPDCHVIHYHGRFGALSSQTFNARLSENRRYYASGSKGTGFKYGLFCSRFPLLALPKPLRFV